MKNPEEAVQMLENLLDSMKSVKGNRAKAGFILDALFGEEESTQDSAYQVSLLTDKGTVEIDFDDGVRANTFMVQIEKCISTGQAIRHEKQILNPAHIHSAVMYTREAKVPRQGRWEDHTDSPG